MMTITTQTRKMIRSTLITSMAAMALMTTTASATTSCNEATYKQVDSHSDWTNDTHIHLDVACPHDYRAISCGFDSHGRNDHDSNKFFVAINDATPAKFDSDHNDRHLQGDYGCHFRANNFKPYFPGNHDFNWRLKGTATCVPKRCVHVDDTRDYYDENFNATWYPDWDQWHR